jgi:predicted PurR-regulated permease PerM
MRVAVGVVAVISLVAALYLARAFFIPLLIGMLASYALHPVVDSLIVCRVPRALAAALVLALLAGGLSWVAVSLTDDVTAMIEKMPDAARKLRQTLSAARTRGPTALQNMQEAASELQGAATDAGAKSGARVTVARPSEPSAWVRDYAVAQSALLFAVASQTPIVLLLAYFLLASGEHFRRKLVQLVGPSLTRKKEAVRILEEIDVQVQRYLLSMLVSNTLVGVATWGAFQALGLQHAGVWGVAAGILHFILNALTVAGASLVVAAAVGFGFTTWLQSRFAGVNAAVLFIALLFFGWLWGVAGLLLCAPLVAIAKVICDRVDSLKPAGELLGR